MGKFADQNQETKTVGGSHFKFSAAKIESLGASEYTIATVVVDVSGSVYPFGADIEAALKQTVQSCRKSPRADNLMLRVVLFNNGVSEVHGFKPLPDCNENDYDGIIQPGGGTALFDATYSSVEAMLQYGTELVKNDFQVNAALFVITDGEDNVSKTTAVTVAKAFVKAKAGEMLESLMSVLIGVNTDQSGLNSFLDFFQKEAGFQQYVAIASADAKTLAKLGGFISKSISSQSQALGTGGASKSLTF
jgi:hypothetical protein